MIVPWFLWRIVLPVAIAGAVMSLTWGNDFFDVYVTLLWTTFVAHLLMTMMWRPTHVLDTGSFICLLFCFSGIANQSEAYGKRGVGNWIAAALAFAAYAFLTYVGRRASTE